MGCGMEAKHSLRRRSRACALQILYQMDVGGDLVSARAARGRASDATDSFFACFGHTEAGDRALTTRLVDGVVDAIMALDARIAEVSLHWRLARMAVVDRNLLRLAAFEMNGPQALPKQVALNEAIELAREYGGAESPAFVNAMLDRLAPAPAAVGV